MGSLDQECIIRRMVSIENQTSASFSIDHIDASCECTSFSKRPLIVPTDSNGQLEIVVDGSHETEFHGDLGIQATAFDQTRPLFKFEIDLNIQSARPKPAAII
jgi:hypothetical protein